MLNVPHNSFPSKTVLPSPFRIILIFWISIWKPLQKVLSSATVWNYWNVLFWWFMKVSYKNYLVYCSFVSICQGFRLQIHIFLILALHNFLMQVFCHKRCLISSDSFFLTGVYLLKTYRIFSFKLFLSSLSHLQAFLSTWKSLLSKFPKLL